MPTYEEKLQLILQLLIEAITYPLDKAKYLNRASELIKELKYL